MPLLENLETTKVLRIFLMGEPGTGKTVFGTSLPGKTRAYDFDKKMDSAYNYWKIHNPEILKRVDVLDCSPFDVKGGAYLRMADDLENIIKRYEQTKVLEYNNLIIDSTTIMAEEMLQWLLEFETGISRNSKVKTRKIASQQDYGVFAPLFRDFIFKVFSIPWNVVMTGHINIKQDEKTGELHRVASIPGRMAKQIGIYFPEFYRTYVKDGKHFAQTKADSYWACRSQIPNLPNPVELDYAKIMEKR